MPTSRYWSWCACSIRPGGVHLRVIGLTGPERHYEKFRDGQQVCPADGVHCTFDGGNVFAPKIRPIIAKLGRRQMEDAHR